MVIAVSVPTSKSRVRTGGIWSADAAPPVAVGPATAPPRSPTPPWSPSSARVCCSPWPRRALMCSYCRSRLPLHAMGMTTPYCCLTWVQYPAADALNALHQPRPEVGGSADSRPTDGRVNRRRRGYNSGVRRKANPAHDAGARPDYHDPTAGLGGAAPARSALTLRLVLASFGLILCSIAAVAALTVVQQPVLALFLAVLAAAAAVDIAVISGRKRRGEPG